MEHMLILKKMVLLIKRKSKNDTVRRIKIAQIKRDRKRKQNSKRIKKAPKGLEVTICFYTTTKQ